jgi:uncharacterized protein (TIGR02270 family)
VSYVIESIVVQHWEEAGLLRGLLSQLSSAPHANLEVLQRFDEGLAAHLDGIAVAGEKAWNLFDIACSEPTAPAIFSAAVRALEAKNAKRVEALIDLAGKNDAARTGLAWALAWLPPRDLQGVVASLLSAPKATLRTVGIMACAAHGVHPGPMLLDSAASDDAHLRSTAIRAIGELGDLEAKPLCASHLRDEIAECRYWTARSGVLLGDRGTARETLGQFADVRGSYALELYLCSGGHIDAHEFLARTEHNVRTRIRGAGVVGDPRYVSWLLRLMDDPVTARLAGEAFTLITGADLDALQLWRDRPEGFESGPTENPDDEDVSLDPDEGLMWPNPAKVAAWWAANESRFTTGQRYFMGAPVTRAHCLDVLKTGYQRQRILAAQYLCLLEPGTPLFNTSAHAWRQQRLLARMT